MNRQHSKIEIDEIARGLWKTGDWGVICLGISLDTTVSEGHRHKDMERRFQRGNEPKPAQIWERSGHLLGKAAILTMS